jgi:hypothetical protein
LNEKPKRKRKPLPRKLYIFYAVIIIAVLCGAAMLTLFLQNTSISETDFVPITVENIAQLELGYALPGSCDGNPRFSPDGTLLAVGGSGVYELSTGSLRFPIEANYAQFSPDGRYLIGSQDGIYDVATGERLFSITTDAQFSRDSSLVAVYSDGVYDVSTHERLFAISGGFSIFSANRNFLAVTGDGIYNVNSWQKVVSVSTPALIVFSPNEMWAAVGKDGVYDLQTGGKVFTISTDGDYYPGNFSRDSSMIGLAHDGLYDTTTWQERFSFGGYGAPIFNSDGTIIAVPGEFVYDVTTGEALFGINAIAGLYFSPDDASLAVWEDGVYDVDAGERMLTTAGYTEFNDDGALVAVWGDGVYDTETWDRQIAISRYAFNIYFNVENTLISAMHLNYENRDLDVSCLIYGIAGNKWAYRSGVVSSNSPVPVYDSPEGTELFTTFNELIVLAQTADNQWYRVGQNQWVRASDVGVMSMPDGVPVENP